MDGSAEKGGGAVAGQGVCVFKNSIVNFFEDNVVFGRFPLLRGMRVFAIFLIDVFDEMAEELIALLS